MERAGWPPDRWSDAERAFALSIVEGILSPTGLVRQIFERRPEF